MQRWPPAHREQQYLWRAARLPSGLSHILGLSGAPTLFGNQRLSGLLYTGDKGRNKPCGPQTLAGAGPLILPHFSLVGLGGREGTAQGSLPLSGPLHAHPPTRH